MIVSLTRGYVRSRNFCITSNKDKGVIFLYTVPFPNPFWLHKEILKDLIFARTILFENKIASNTYNRLCDIYFCCNMSFDTGFDIKCHSAVE